MIKAKIVFSIFLTFTTVSLFAGLPPSSCGDVNARNTLFNTFIMQTRGTTKQQRDAIKTARSFVRIYGNCPDPNSRSAASTVRDWQKQNDNAVELAFFDAVNNNPAQAFAAAQPLLTAHSDDLGLQLALVLAGVKLLKAGDHSHIAESLAASQAALKLIESGKTTDDWAPFTTAQDAPDGLRYYTAVFCAETAPEQAVANLLEVTRSKNTFSADATTYQLLGGLTYKNGSRASDHEVPVELRGQGRFAGRERPSRPGESETGQSDHLLCACSGTERRQGDAVAAERLRAEGARRGIHATARRLEGRARGCDQERVARGLNKA